MMPRGNQKLVLSILLVASVIATVAPASLSLSKSNFDEMTKDKTVFIEFFAPWCGHCKELAPQWQKMANEWDNHKQGLVAQVDCTAEEEWCVSMGIEGFPTLLFGDPSQGGVFLEKYTGDKTYEDLSKFANETLIGPVCSPGNPDLCDEATKQTIQQFWKLSPSDIKEAINRERSLIVEAETNFEEAFQKMQTQYDNNSQDYEMRMADKRADVKLLRDILERKK